MMKNFKANFQRDTHHSSLISHYSSLTSTLALTLILSSFGGVGVTKKQLDRTVSEINSNMAAAVSAEIDRNIDGHIERIGRESAMAATNFLPTFIEGLGEFADASQFALTDFTTNSLTFNDTFISNGVFVSIPRKAYFKASWVCPTNKGFTVTSSSYPGIPSGTMFAVDEIPVAHTNHPMRVHNASGAPNGGQLVWKRHLIHNADMFKKPLELLWCEERHEIGVVETNRIISESALYDAKIGRDVQSSTAYQTVYKMEVVRSGESTSPNWVNSPSSETHIVTLTDIGGVFRMAVVDNLEKGGRILGSFTLVPVCLTDAEAHTARTGTPKLSAGLSVMRFIRKLFVPDAVAARHHDIFTSQAGMPQFCITWTTEDGEVLGESWIAVSRQPRKTKVDDNGMEHDTGEFYVPCPWYTRDDWRTVENWISFPAQYTIYYADSLGRFQTEKGTRYGISNRMINNATFKSLFLGHREMLDSLYVYPRKVEKRDPCKEGRHSYVHCVCSVCGNQREHKFIKSGDCYRCGWEESIFTVDENNEIVEVPGSSSACGFVPDSEEYHGGWHGVGEQVDEAGNLRYCGCSCGHYSDSNDRYFPRGYEGSRAGSGLMHLTIDHLFLTDANDIEWQPGDEFGDKMEDVHHAILHCHRDCGTTTVIVENHAFYNPDGSLHDCSVYGDGNENYHIVAGTCIKCSEPTSTTDLHRRQLPNEGDGSTPCVCIGGVKFDTEGCGEVHHLYKVTACGEVRCLYCLAYHEESPRLKSSEHSGVQPVCSSGDEILVANEQFPVDGSEPMRGVVLRARVPTEDGHPCGCGLVMLPHNFIENPDTGVFTCPDTKPSGYEMYWWAANGCGLTKTQPDDTDGRYDLTVECEDSRGAYSLKGRTYRISSFSWNPSKGEQPPTPEQLWPDDKNRPSSLPPLEEEMGNLAPTVVDFTYATEFTSSWVVDWTWKAGKWVKKNRSFWKNMTGGVWNSLIQFR